MRDRPIIRRLYGLIFRYTRRPRMLRFVATLNVSPGDRVIDVGGTGLNWRYCNVPLHLLLVNADRDQREAAEAEGYRWEQGDGCALQYADKAFDIAFSNSVIEHVGDWQAQERFAREIRRVASAYWVQTPAKAFPFEPHFIGLFLHWLPPRWRNLLMPLLSLRYWLDPDLRGPERAGYLAIRLLSYREMERLFPDAVIEIERFIGMPRSYIAWRKT